MARVENEKRLDRFVRRVCIGAWVFTLALVVFFAILVGATVVPFIRAASNGELPWATVLGTSMPLIGALWTLSLLVAALSTVGVFLRLRTASLSEIQLRLASLEEMLASRPDSQQT